MLDAPELTATVCFTSYRFRLINIACDPNYVFTIAGHNLTVIEADGQNTEPLTVDEIQIFAAQRYSFVVSTSSHPASLSETLVADTDTAS